MHEETRVNLHSVMRDQAYAHAVLWTSAQHARSDVAVAVLFERAARARLEEHFARLTQLAEPDARIADLLADAIRLDTQQDYRELIAQAHHLGDIEVAEALSAIQAFRDAELEALQAARMRYQLTAQPPAPTEPPTEPAPVAQPAPDDPTPVDLPPVAVIATVPIQEPPPGEPLQQALPSHEPSQPTVDETSPYESQAERPDANAEQEVEDSQEPVVEDSEEQIIEDVPTPESEVTDADELPPPEEQAGRESADEYHVIYIDKHTQKSAEGARELETRLGMLAQDGWHLSAAIGSQLILHRTRR